MKKLPTTATFSSTCFFNYYRKFNVYFLKKRHLLRLNRPLINATVLCNVGQLASDGEVSADGGTMTERDHL